MLTSPIPYGPPNRNRTGITWVEARSSTVELWADELEDFVCIYRMMGTGAPDLPGPELHPVLFVPAQLSCDALQRVTASGPGTRLNADGYQGPHYHTRQSSRTGGSIKKPPRPSGRGGFVFLARYWLPPPRPDPVCFAARISTGFGPSRYELTKESVPNRWGFPATAHRGRLGSVICCEVSIEG